MVSTMTTRNASRHTAATRGGGTSEQDDREGGQESDQGSQGSSRANGANEGGGGLPDFATIIAQQLQNLLPNNVAQVGNHVNNQGNNGNQNDNVVNNNNQCKVRIVNMNNGRGGCSYKEFMACNPKDYDGKGGAIVYTHWIEKMELVQDMSGCEENEKVKYSAGSFIVGMLTDEAIRNGSLKKNTEKRGNSGEPSRDVRDDNKRSWTRRAFATTTNLVRKEYTVWEFAMRRPWPFAARPSMKLGKRSALLKSKPKFSLSTKAFPPRVRKKVPSREWGKGLGRNAEGGSSSEIGTRENRSKGTNLPPLLAAHLGRGESDQPLQSSLTSVYGGHQPSINVGGNLHSLWFTYPITTPSNSYPFYAQPMYALPNMPTYPNPNPAGPFTDLMGLVTPFVCWIEDYPLLDGLKTPSHIGSYDGKGDPDNFLQLFEGAIRMQKWLMPMACQRKPLGMAIEERQAGIGSSPTKDLTTDCSLAYLKTQERFSLQKRNQIEETIKSGQLSHLVKGIKKEKAKAFDNQRGEWKKDKGAALIEAHILMISQEESYTRDNISKELTSEGREITFPSVTKGSNSSTSVIIKAMIFGREVGRVYMDSRSSCKVIYEHCFLKLKPFIRESKVDSKVPLIRSNSPHNLLLERTWMQKMEIVVSTIHEAIKFHTARGIGTVFFTQELGKIEEGQKKAKEVSLADTKGVLSCTNAKEKIIINYKYVEQTVVIGKQLPEYFKERLRELLRSNPDVFAWTHADMTGIPRTIMFEGKPFNTEHKLNEYSHIKPIK
ncbi:hypothetical protein Tco_1155652 [Tanacetum coccineum]